VPSVLLLASRSPRRAALLKAAGIPFEPGPFPDVDERVPRGPGGEPLAPAATVQLLAERKALAAVRMAPDRRVLAADTLVFLDGRPLGKPADAAEAAAMLRALSRRTHEVATGAALAGPDGAGGVRMRSGAAVTQVRFRSLGDDEIEAYVRSREPLDKAGAYAVQGGAAGFVEALEGDRDTVIGLSVRLVRELLEAWAGAQETGAAGA